MLIVSIGWVFVVGAFALAHATAPGGTLLGALLALLLGLAPLAVVLYLAEATALRRRAHASALDPDGGGHAAGDAIAPEREEP